MASEHRVEFVVHMDDAGRTKIDANCKMDGVPGPVVAALCGVMATMIGVMLKNAVPGHEQTVIKRPLE